MSQVEKVSCPNCNGIYMRRICCLHCQGTGVVDSEIVTETDTPQIIQSVELPLAIERGLRNIINNI